MDAKLLKEYEDMEGLSGEGPDGESNDPDLASAAGNSLVDMGDDLDNDPSFKPIQASSLTALDIFYEMERRGLKSTGFPEIDKDILQRAFNEEFQAKAEEELAKIKERKRRQAQQAGLQRRRMQMEQTLQEEQDVLASSHQLGMMIELIKDDAVASSIRIEVNSISARSLAKVMWVNTCVTCLDLSSNKLDDHAGAYVARILTRNKTLKKMELDNNEFSHKTLAAFGESLRVNNSLVYLSVDSNPLFTNDDTKGSRSFAEALRLNTTLTSLNLWRTGMKPADGELLASALDHNSVLLFVDISHNGVKMREMKRIADKLDRNMAAYEASERVRREESMTDEQKQKKINDELEAIEKDKELKAWLETRRADRAEAKRLKEEERIAEAQRAAEVRKKQLAEQAERERKEKEEAAAKKAAKAKKAKK